MKAAYIAIALGTAAWSCSSAFAAEPVVRTDAGQVRGTTDEDGVQSWKGIPFAAPPVGPLRWRAPQPAPAWPAIRSAATYGHDCMQLPFPSDAAPLGTPPAEDCLYMNVWRPADGRQKLPVVLWIYGGGFVNGGSSPPTYTGDRMARRGVVFASFNYRVGRFGAFAHPLLTKAAADQGRLGNYGYMDQIAALNWVRRNIAAFGGNPANITVVGESAGGSSVHMLLTSPETRGLVARAVVMSGGDGTNLASGEQALSAAETVGANFAASKGIAADDPDALTKLRALPAEDVVAGLNMASSAQTTGPRTYSGPFADGKVAVPTADAYRRGAFTKVPVMIGATSADMGGPTGRMVAGARALAGIIAGSGAPVYAYRFSYVAESGSDAGARHATDIPFFLDTADIKYASATTARDKTMARSIADYLANFARTGNPNGGTLPRWPRYAAADDVIMDFTGQGKPVSGHDPLGAIAQRSAGKP